MNESAKAAAEEARRSVTEVVHTGTDLRGLELGLWLRENLASLQESCVSAADVGRAVLDDGQTQADKAADVGQTTLSEVSSTLVDGPQSLLGLIDHCKRSLKQTVEETEGELSALLVDELEKKLEAIEKEFDSAIEKKRNKIKEFSTKINSFELMQKPLLALEGSPSLAQLSEQANKAVTKTEKYLID